MTAEFLELHQGEGALLMPNPWDVGSARVLASLGFKALATTSSGFAGTLGRLDGSVMQEEAIAHVSAVASAVDVPINADLENCFADDPGGVATTIELAAAAGAAGASVEDYDRERDTIYDRGLAVERVAAAAEAAHRGADRIVLTARAENLVHGRRDLDDTIARLQAFQEAGADVLFAPGLHDLGDIRRVVDSVDRPVSVLVHAGAPALKDLEAAGVKRVSVGGGFFYAAMAAVVDAGRELLDEGTYGFGERSGAGRKAVRAAFT